MKRGKRTRSIPLDVARQVRCRSGKRAYLSEAAAQNVLGRIWSSCKPGRQLECRAYHCGHCGYWHLTSMPLAMGA